MFWSTIYMLFLLFFFPHTTLPNILSELFQNELLRNVLCFLKHWKNSNSSIFFLHVNFLINSISFPEQKLFQSSLNSLLSPAFENKWKLYLWPTLRRRILSELCIAVPYCNEYWKPYHNLSIKVQSTSIYPIVPFCHYYYYFYQISSLPFFSFFF